MTREYICSYNDHNTDAMGAVFECWASSEEEAYKKCREAKPTAYIAEVYLAEEH